VEKKEAFVVVIFDIPTCRMIKSTFVLYWDSDIINSKKKTAFIL